jgi:hypothetical protein
MASPKTTEAAPVPGVDRQPTAGGRGVAPGSLGVPHSAARHGRVLPDGADVGGPRPERRARRRGMTTRIPAGQPRPGSLTHPFGSPGASSRASGFPYSRYRRMRPSWYSSTATRGLPDEPAQDEGLRHSARDPIQSRCRLRIFRNFKDHSLVPLGTGRSGRSAAPAGGWLAGAGSCWWCCLNCARPEGLEPPTS